MKKGFYDAMPIQRADGFVVQTGQPEGADGYVDSATGQLRRIPFEVRVVGEREPYYENTLEDMGVYNAPVVLPFNAFGTMAMAREDVTGGANTALSQFFWLLKDAELTPVGSNVLDGRYATFGYVTEGAELLAELRTGDRIRSMKVISGLDKLVPGDSQAPAVTFEF